MKTRLLFSVLAITALTALVSAQTTEPVTPQAGKGRAAGNAWVDADNDGVCDNYTNGTRPGRRAYSAGENQAAGNRGPGKGQGLAQGQRNGQGRGPGMAPGRGPGRAQAAAPGRGPGRAQAAAPGRGRNNGQGPAFVDANKDGVCDNLQTSSGTK